MKYKIIAEYNINEIKSISIAIDSCYYDEEEDTTIKTKRVRRAFNPGEMQEMVDFFNQNNVDGSEAINLANLLWTKDVIKSFEMLQDNADQ